MLIVCLKVLQIKRMSGCAFADREECKMYTDYVYAFRDSTHFWDSLTQQKLESKEL